MKEKYIKICPKCGSTRIGFRGITKSILINFCEDCKYGLPTGNAIFPEIKESEVKKFKKQLKK